MFEKGRDEEAVIAALNYFESIGTTHDKNKLLKFLDHFFQKTYEETKSKNIMLNTPLAKMGEAEEALWGMVHHNPGDRVGTETISDLHFIEAYGNAFGIFFAVCEYRLGEIKDEDDMEYFLELVEGIGEAIRKLKIKTEFIRNILTKIMRKAPPQQRGILKKIINFF